MTKIFKLLPLFSLMLVGLSSCNNKSDVDKTSISQSILTITAHFVKCVYPSSNYTFEKSDTDFSFELTYEENHVINKYDLDAIRYLMYDKTPQELYQEDTYFWEDKIKYSFGVDGPFIDYKNAKDTLLEEGDVFTSNITDVYYSLSYGYWLITYPE